MKKLLAATIFLLITVSAFCQTAPDTLWTKTYPAFSGESIVEADNHSLIAVGSVAYEFGHYNMYLVNVNSSGDTLWVNLIPDPYITDDIAEDICKTQDGSFIVTGQYRGKPILSKITSDGDSLWFKQYSALNAWKSYSLDISDDGKIAFCGIAFDQICYGYHMITDSTGFLMNTVLHPYNTTYLDNAACHVIKFISNDEIANLVNVAYEVNPDSLWGYSYLVKTDLEGNELMTIPMNYSMHLDMVYSNDGAYVIAADLSVKKYDSNGILLFNRQIPFVAKSIIQKDDDFIIAGNIDGNVHVMRIDEDGNQIWHAMYETDSTDIINCVTSTEDGGFALTGKSDNQFYIMKLGADNSSTLNDYCCDPCTFSLNNYPNPFNPSTTIAFSLQNHAEIEVSIFNTKGQKIKQLMSSQMSAGQQSINWNGEDEAGKSVSSGIYYYKLNVNGKTEAVKKCLLLK